MKVLVALRRPRGLDSVNLRITADGTATVGDVARAIAACPESGLGGTDERLTLRSFDELYSQGRDLSPKTLLLHSGVTSGSDIEIVPPAEAGGSGDVVAVLRIVGGPDTGTEIPLHRGVAVIGRGADCSVRLRDARASKRHAEVAITDRIEITDLNSANGVEIGGVRVSRVVLKDGESFTLGASILRVELVGELGPSATSTDIEFVRSPRLISRPRVQTVKAPDVPTEPQPNPFPLLATLAPLIMGAVMYMFTQSMLSVVFIALSPILMISTWASTAAQARRKRKREALAFREAVTQLDAQLGQANDEHRTQLLSMFPSLDECLGEMGTLGPLIWSRRPELPEFGQLRLGLGDVESVRHVEIESAKGRRDLLAELVTAVKSRSVVPQAPVVADLLECGSLGVTGERGAAAAVARGLVMQLAITHSPTEVLLTCLTSAAGEQRWNWMDWLPHVNASSPMGDLHLASDEANGRRLLDRIEALMESRSGDERKTRSYGPVEVGVQSSRPEPVLPLLVVLVDDSPVDVARLIRLTERGPELGVHVIWIERRVQNLPAACRTYLDVDSSVVGMVRHETSVTPIESEGLDFETAVVAARAISPVADASAIDDDESDVPTNVSMVGLLGEAMSDDPDQIVAHWQENGSLVDRSGPPRERDSKLPLRALVGHTGLEAFTLDLRSQGPHALVGGTTGAGKSEFLQAWLLGMANAYSPDRLTFLLIDYKGGTAFAHCVKLPHCVGLVTDLSRHLVGRALQSLRAEIHYRETLLNEKQAKDLIELEMRGDPDCPPSLIIVVDEFAALKMEFPEFVDGMVDVAQRGRSLGLHLVLATQRPAGVIGDNIRANTNLRIALRMNDEPDSKDIIDHVMSAHIAPEAPGRGVARVGPGRLQKFQSAYPGARTAQGPVAPSVSLEAVSFGNRQEWKVPRPVSVGPKIDRDIERIVSSIRAASDKAGVPEPRLPWRQELSSAYDLLKIRQRRDDELALGVLDDPDHQEQRFEYFRPDEDINLLIVGAGGSGKTTALRTVALASAITPRTGPVHVYGMDFTGRGLISLEVMPNVGSIIPGTDAERVARLLRTLDGMVTDRGKRFADVNASSLPEYRQLADRPNEPRILLLMDGYSVFQEEYYISAGKGHLFQIFQRLVTEGRAVGIHVVITIERAGAVTPAVSAAFPRKLVLRMAEENAYLDLGVPKDALTAASPPGRAISSPGNAELQIACIGGVSGVADQVGKMELLAASVARHQVSRPAPIRSLPTLVNLSELPESGSSIIGLADATLQPLLAPRSGVSMVTGPRGSGKSNAIAVWAHTLHKAEPSVELVHLAARRSPISDLAVWSRSAVGASEVEVILRDLAGHISAGSGGRIAVFCEGAPALSDLGLSNELAEVVRGLRDTDNLFVGEGPADAWGSAYDLAPILKAGKQMLLLQLSDEEGYSHLDQPLPKLAPADRTPGRGFWADVSGVAKVQVPVHA